VSRYDWLVSLHVLAAFALVAGYVLYGVMIAWSWRRETPADMLRLTAVSRAGNALVWVGALGTLLLGIWLALDVDGYSLLDGWILAALVLWAIAMETGRRSGTLYARAATRAGELAAADDEGPSTELRTIVRDRRALMWQALSSLAVLLLLYDMIYKPGA
jgi:Predicted integral membrane protein (DUF2269)